MRGATVHVLLICLCSSVSIHAPHAGRDDPCANILPPTKSFNPRAPCGARQADGNSPRTRTLFQSTRPMRGATVEVRGGDQFPEFQSTRPMRGATRVPLRGGGFRMVSIHAPHAGRDLFIGKDFKNVIRFNPRAPYGARRIASPCVKTGVTVSIHAPHAGRDSL